MCESLTSSTKKLVKKVARMEASSIYRQQFANVFADLFAGAFHTHQLEFTITSLLGPSFSELENVNSFSLFVCNRYFYLLDIYLPHYFLDCTPSSYYYLLLTVSCLLFQLRIDLKNMQAVC